MQRRRILPRLALTAALFLSTAGVSLAQSTSGGVQTFERPALTIPIPNLSFSQIQVVDAAGSRTIDIPWLAEYINAAFRYGVYLASVFAVVMFMVGGFQYLVSGSGSEGVKKGKQRITDAVIGLMLALFSYTLLQVINPDLVTGKPLHITQVERIDFTTTEGSLKAFGNTADESAYSSPEASADGGGSPGQYRQDMMSVCGSRNGLSLAPADRVTLLKKIVEKWKTVGADQGGAIYVRGGNASCGFSNPQSDFVLGSMVTLYKNNVQLPFSGTCSDAVETAAKGSSGQTISSLAKANEGACRKDWVAAYNDIVMRPAKEAGLLCGDCFTYQMSLYGCFDKTIDYASYFSKKRISQVCPTPGPGYVFVLGRDADGMSDEKINAAVSQLKFGDVIAWQQLKGNKSGHVFMYTGGQGLNYQIVEMGGGGSNDISSSGGIKASKNAGYKWVGAGVQAHTSATTFLQASRANVLKNNGQGCIYAFRPLEN